MHSRVTISKVSEHNGGIAYIDLDAGEHHFLVCTGCGVDEFRPCTASALLALSNHLDAPQGPSGCTH